jgi:2,4-dienoyl-CoA reductase (NADPH2)
VLAEQILADGTADLIGLGRALIADPEWANKAAGQHAGSIRPCIGFVQDCRMAHGGAACAVNAAAGRELTYGIGTLRRASAAGTVVVVGGGPGGLEAARLAAESGHSVTLFEREDVVGGQVRRAARGPQREELLEFIDYLHRELQRLSVDVRTSTEADVASVRELDPLLAVVATGAVGTPVPLPGGSLPNVLSVWDLLDGQERSLGQTAVVADDGTGFWPTCSAAELLVSRGVHVKFLTPAAAIGSAIPLESIALLHRRLRGAGVEYHPFSVIERVVDTGHVEVRDTTTQQIRTESADSVVVLTSPRAQDDLLRELQAAGVPAEGVGDCLAPRRITHAVLDANRVVRALVG